MAYAQLTAVAAGDIGQISWANQVKSNFEAWTGMVTMYAGSSIPTGWLDCNGAAVSRTTYADLFAAIGTTHGSGDGSTTFNVPDIRGRAPIGVGTGSGLTARALAASGGAETHQLITSEMPAHTHTQQIIGGGAIASSGAPVTLACTNTATNTGSAGGDGAHNNMPPWRALYFAIKT